MTFRGADTLVLQCAAHAPGCARLFMLFVAPQLLLIVSRTANSSANWGMCSKHYLMSIDLQMDASFAHAFLQHGHKLYGLQLLVIIGVLILKVCSVCGQTESVHQHLQSQADGGHT